MGKTPEDVIGELFRQIGALGRELDRSDDPQAAAERVAVSLEALRAQLAGLDAGQDAEAAFVRATAAIARMRDELQAAGADDAPLADLEDALARGGSAEAAARALDERTGGAFSRYRAANEARALEAIKRDARANAERGARQVKPDLDLGDTFAPGAADAAGEDET